MIYMSVALVLFDRDLIFMVHCTVLSFCVLVYFYTIIGQLYLLYGGIVSCTCLPGMVHLTLTSFSWFIGLCLVILVS